MRTNDVTLFSNGIGHFRRIYTVQPGNKPERISIPFKRDHIGDVAASLQVFGNVRLTTPPSFTPTNANATALRIEQNDAYRSILRNLSGAGLTVEFTDGTKKECTLLGLDSQETHTGETSYEQFFIVLMQQGKICRKGFWEIKDLHFNEESVRTEIDKALKNNFQLIKPDSTLLDISLTPTNEGAQEAVVQYTIPVAAWKMRYAIREEKGKFSLEGAAIIDNNTDEDWDNFRVSVVTGNPISFNTDIANVSMPARKFVRLVDNAVLGNVEAEEAWQENYSGGAVAACATTKGVRARNLGPKMSMSNCAQFGLESLEQRADGSANLDLYYPAAEAPGVESKEVGDFSVFTSKEPITILARKSAVVPMFTVPLSKAGIVLLYKEGNHPRRPYRTVKFKNESEYSLGKGKTVIYNEGIFSGECVLETTKPGENRMLPHCLENGVKVGKETMPVQSRRNSLKISEGVAIDEHVSTAQTLYTLENKKNETFKLALEHNNVLAGQSNVMVDFDGAEIKEKEKLVSTDGHRVYIELAPNQQIKLKATETSVNVATTVIGNYYQWLKLNIIDTKNPLGKDKQVVACVKVQQQIDEVGRKIEEAKARRLELKEQGERVRENLAAAKDVGNSTLVAEWVKDLDSTEKEIRKIDKETLTSLQKEQKDLQSKLTDELKKISVNWASEVKE